MPIIEDTRVKSRPDTANGAGGPAHFLAKHASFPKGLIGALFGAAMKKMNREPYEWVLDEMMSAPSDKILEIGFGAGYGLRSMARRNPKAKIFGLEHSPTMLRAAQQANRDHLNEGRMQLMLGAANAIPLPDNHVNQVFCVHVTYFWTNPEKEFSELFRVLSPVGKVYIFIGDQEEMSQVKMTQTGVYSLHSTEYLTECLISVGFSKVVVKEKSVKSGPVNKGICIIADKVVA